MVPSTSSRYVDHIRLDGTVVVPRPRTLASLGVTDWCFHSLNPEVVSALPRECRAAEYALARLEAYDT
jgi:hypothetical protein